VRTIGRSMVSRGRQNWQGQIGSGKVVGFDMFYIHRSL
jgi:hypothetical protein